MIASATAANINEMKKNIIENIRHCLGLKQDQSIFLSHLTDWRSDGETAGQESFYLVVSPS